MRIFRHGAKETGREFWINKLDDDDMSKCDVTTNLAANEKLIRTKWAKQASSDWMRHYLLCKELKSFLIDHWIHAETWKTRKNIAAAAEKMEWYEEIA